MQTEIYVIFIIADVSGGKHLNMTLIRYKFESLVSNLIERTHIPFPLCELTSRMLMKFLRLKELPGL
jgi:molecular chaperone DnaK